MEKWAKRELYRKNTAKAAKEAAKAERAKKAAAKKVEAKEKKSNPAK